jgi:predicted XRE-type DNA-binding protein
MKKHGNHYINEEELERRIAKGEIEPVFVPKLASLSDIAKYQYCNLIIKFKKDNNLKQKDIAQQIDLNKSEVSKLFSYQLKEFSQDRLIGFVEILIKKGAKIDLSEAFSKIEKQSKKLQKKLEKDFKVRTA